MSYRPLARLYSGKKRAVAPRAGRRIAWKLCATRVITRWRRGQTPSCCSPPQPLPPTPAQRVRFGSRRAARAADEPATAATIDEPAAAATIAANQGKYDGRQEAGRQV